MKKRSVGNGASPRRQFIRTFALGSASTVIGAPWVGTFIGTMLTQSTAQAASDGVLNLALSNFPALLNPMGSVRVSVSPISGPYPTGDFFPIVITRDSNNGFYAVNSMCTHRGCIVDAFDGTSIVCPCHGSEFAMDGTVTKGPAGTDLTSYSVAYDGFNSLKVTVPGLGYSITRCRLVTGAYARVELDFPTFSQVQYEVRFRQTTTDAWTVVPFATGSTGAATNTVLTGDGLEKTVYVDPTSPHGFYCVSIRVSAV